VSTQSGQPQALPQLPSQEETIARSSKRCACDRCPAQAATERRRPHVQRTCSVKAGEAATVVLVDDDPSVLRALSRLIRAAGFKVLTFDRPSALLASAIPRANACMVVDVNLPEMSGSDLCSALAASGRGLPAILITGRNDIATQRLIAKAQVVASLFKPVDEQALLDAIARAFVLSDG
jgi:CheY-like chemotaxis protein